ncbi:MAG: hypothetical protein KGL39_10905 [Patescibacteria group bacterium]|nr:hypothetical protein [Patescibacteria group bacterium]
MPSEQSDTPDELLDRPAPPARSPNKRREARSTPDDGVPIDQIAASAPDAAKKGGVTRKQVAGLKTIVLLFLSFLLVVSDVFTNNVVSLFRGSVKARAPTSYGIVLQGIFLVLFFILAIHLSEVGII